LTTNRAGWRSIVDLSFCVLIVVACGSVSLLTYSGAPAPVCRAARSEDCFVLSESSAPPMWTAESQGRRQDLPAENNDVDDSDDDDDDDDAGALLGGAIALTADHGPARLLVEAPAAEPSSPQSGSSSLRGPPRMDQDELTCSPGRHKSDQSFRPSAWIAADSHHHPQNSSPDNHDVDDCDLDDRDDDDDDDDDGNDDSAGALAAASIELTADHADGRRVIDPNSDARSPVGCEAQSLRGPPCPLCPDSPPSLDDDIPNHTSQLFFASDRHWLRALPRSISGSTSRARKRIGTETRSQL